MEHSPENPDNYRQDQGHAYGFVRHEGSAEHEKGDSRAAGRRGGYRGVGPIGYTRPDARIVQEVCDRLYEDDDIDASEISVSISDGEITLNGFVPSRWTKRAAEDRAEECPGVTHVQNNLRVRGNAQPAGGDASGN